MKHPPEPGLPREGAGLATSPSKGEHLGHSGSGEFRLQHPHPQLGLVFNLRCLGGFAPWGSRGGAEPKKQGSFLVGEDTHVLGG